ncbi:MAG TPA: helix-hairpin-helix domain-containing protein [Kofleriaceae bacterium]|jgi:competence protein ComEA|nr:helix-hairpin-helix domain-containing protein [Kofleriaceae bacterium]
MIASEPAGRTLLLLRRLGAAAALVVLGAAVASALGSTPAAAGPEANLAPPPPPPTPPPIPATSEPCSRGQPAGGAGVININEASADQLQLLPGIGPARAALIVEERRRRGRFTRLRELRRVKGIGARTLQRLTPMLRLDGPTTMTAKGKRAGAP